MTDKKRTSCNNVKKPDLKSILANLEVEKVNVFFRGIFVGEKKLKKRLSYDEIFLRMPDDVEISFDFTTQKMNFYYKDSDMLLDKELGAKSLGQKAKRIVKYMEVFEALSVNLFVDDYINMGGANIPLGYVETICKRAVVILNEILIEFINNKNYLVASILLRDLIESIKLFLVVERGHIKETVINDGEWTVTREEENIAKRQEILSCLNGEKKSWEFDIKRLMENNVSMSLWDEELKRLRQINEECNRIMHKNGYARIIPQLISESDVSLDDILFVAKFLFALVVFYDGKVISSDDYGDYLDMGLEPPKGSETWSAKIFQDFINYEFTEQEKEKLKEKCYMDI